MSTGTKTLELGLTDAGLSNGCRSCGSGSSCGCDCNGGCSGGQLERPRWFAGQLVGPADLEALQQWVIGRSRRHNRMLHGWGVSCGLAVTQSASITGNAEPWSITVSPGYGLSACGDDISVGSPVRVDIRQPRPSGSDACAPPVDPWCAPVRQRREPDRTYYLAIRYAEENRRPVRGCGCGCDDEACEYSRVAEGYALAVLDELPDCYEDARVSSNIRELAASRILAAERDETARSALGCSPIIKELGTRPCPDCCSPWLVLANLRVSAAGEVTIDPLSHRRFLASLPELAFSCAPAIAQPQPKGYTTAEKDVLSRAFTESHVELADVTDRGATLVAPASALRGARVSNQVRELIGDRSVAELANTDLGSLRAAAAGVGAAPEAIEKVHDLAVLVTRLANI